MATYSVQVINNSKTAWKFFLYQPCDYPSFQTLAWLASAIQIRSGYTTVFIWQSNYQFVWGATGIVKTGTIFIAGGEINCDPQAKNATTFTIQDGTPVFSDPVSGRKNTLAITDGPKVPFETYAVGIGMSGSGTVITQAEPTITHMFTPTTGYYIAAIEEVEQGEVMDIKTITKNAEIHFPTGVYNMTATFQADDTWIITPSSVEQGTKVPQVDQVGKGAHYYWQVK